MGDVVYHNDGISAECPKYVIIDGQQRLTSIYSSLYNINPVHTRTYKGKDIQRYYYIDIEKALDPSVDRVDAIVSVSETRVITSNFGRDIDLDLSTPDKEYEYKMFPLNIILDTPKTFVWQQEYLKYHNNESDVITEYMGFQTKIIMAVIQYKMPLFCLIKVHRKKQYAKYLRMLILVVFRLQYLSLLLLSVLWMILN